MKSVLGVTISLILAVQHGAAADLNEKPPVGWRALWSRRLQKPLWQHRKSGDFSFERPREPEETYWWKFTKSDCGYDDVGGSCQGKSVEGCKAQCVATKGCGGFNFPHGILKKTDCLTHKAPEGSVDLYVLEDHPMPPPPPPVVNFPPIWPHPASFTSGKANVSVDALTWKFVDGSAGGAKDLEAAFERFAPLFFPHKVAGDAAGALTSVHVSVADVSGTLQLETDESYTLEVPLTGSVRVTAKTVFGAMHALESLSQLLVFRFDSQTYEVPFAPWSITDAPRFQHREVLVDTARHFQPVATLKRFIQSLTYSKVNTVHWHLVDSQSFPFDSPSHPRLGKMGSYSPQERYSVMDVEDVVEFARQRGVRIMVEFDMPGHAAAWCKGYPEICPSTTCLQPLNPATNATFELIDGLFQDVTGGKRGSGLFFDNVMHLGGDEVNTGCWGSVASVAAWLKQHGLDANGGYEYFVKRGQAIAHSKQRDVAGWEEIWNHFGTELDKTTIIHQWLPGSTISLNATSHGYRCLWSTDGVWYLDGLGSTYETMYSQEPCKGISDTACSTLMMGGGGEQWGETVDTSDLEQTVWPRLGAIAERLWSPRNISSADAAAARYRAFRCMLNQRGVRAAPSMNPKARSAPPGPGSCYEQ